MAQEIYKQYDQFISSQKTNPDIGITFNNGWSPVLELENVGSGYYLKFSSWTGGEGDVPTAPPIGWEYVTANGFGQFADAKNLLVTTGTSGLQIDEAITPYSTATPTKDPYVVYDTSSKHVWIYSGTTWYDAGTIDNSGKADKVLTTVTNTIFVNDGTGNLMDSTIPITSVSNVVFTETLDGLVPKATGLTSTKRYLSDHGTWDTSGGGGGVTNFEDLDDVDVSTKVDGDSVYYDGSKWLNETAFSGLMRGLDGRYFKVSYSTTGTTTISNTFPYEFIDVTLTVTGTRDIVLTTNSNITTAWLWVKANSANYSGTGVITISEAYVGTLATITNKATLLLFEYTSGHWYKVSELIDVTKIATTSATGIVQLASSAEVQTGTEPLHVITPAGLTSRSATTARTGLVQLATSGETLAGTEAFKVVTCSDLGTKIPLQQFTVAIGDWDMTAATGDSIITVTHALGTGWKGVRQIDVIIRNDADLVYYPIEQFNTSGNVTGGGKSLLTATSIGLYRVTGGVFDSSDFVNTSYNRGWITFWL